MNFLFLVSYIESGEWLECTEDLKQIREKKPTKAYKMTVENIEVLYLTANWLCRANFGSVKPQVSCQYHIYSIVRSSPYVLFTHN